MKNLSDILAEMEKQGFELGRLYTDKDRPPFKTNLTEGKRWKVYIQGESEPFIIGGKNERDVKELAHQMTYPTKIKIKKIVREGKLTEKIKPKQKITKKEWSKIKKFNKHIGQDGTHYVTQLDKKLGTILVPVIVEGKITEGHTISFSKEEMTKLHKDGSIEKDGHTYVYQEGFGKK